MSDAPFEELYPEIMRRTRKTRKLLARDEVSVYRRDDLRHSRSWRDFVRAMREELSARNETIPHSLSQALPGDNIKALDREAG